MAPGTPADLPDLPGVEHHFVPTPSGVRIHVAEAGSPDGATVMLVHGFPQNWWEWRHQIGPLAADGYRVIVPDLRGAGWSDAPRTRYPKSDMADDLLAVLDGLGVARVHVAAHDWGGPPSFMLMLAHSERVSGFLGFNTIAPWIRLDLRNLLHTWSLWYQLTLLTPGVGPRLIGSDRQRYLRWLVRWVGGGWTWPERDAEIFLGRLRDPARAYAGSQWYRTYQAFEFLPWLRGTYADRRVGVPLHWVTGLKDPVISPSLHSGYDRFGSDITHEHVPDVGHWIVEQAPDLALDRLRHFLAE
jgi:pimeloyl-ACP methyl ester carboxylesterase